MTFLQSLTLNATETLYAVCAGIGLIILLYIVVKIAKAASRKKAAADKKRAEQAAKEAEYQRKLQEEKLAAEAFKERRSVDLKKVEENRRVAGASAITGKENIIK